jgi:hypothetical protein
MSLMAAGTIEIPNSLGTSFDYAALEPETRRVFIAHTARDCLEVVDADTNQHLATLQGFPGAAGVVASDGRVLVTNRGGASLASVDARSLKTLRVLNTGPRPNGAAFVSSLRVGVVACIGDDTHTPQLQVFGLEDDRKWSMDLPGRPRWCVIDAKEERVFLAIRNPSMVFVANLPDLSGIQHWPLPPTAPMGWTSTMPETCSMWPATADRWSRSMFNPGKCGANARWPAFRTRPSLIRQAGSCMWPLRIQG